MLHHHPDVWPEHDVIILLLLHTCTMYLFCFDLLFTEAVYNLSEFCLLTFFNSVSGFMYAWHWNEIASKKKGEGYDGQCDNCTDHMMTTSKTN